MRWMVVIVLACGCGGGGGGRGGNDGGGPRAGQPRLRAKLDLTGVIGLAIASPAQARLAGDAGVCGSSTLYALDADGNLVMTTVTEIAAAGDAGPTCSTTTQSEKAGGVFDTPAYDVITYLDGGLTSCQPGEGDGGPPCERCPFVVVRKADGALFCSGMSPLAHVDRVEGDGDILYLSQLATTELVRLDMTASPPTQTVADDGTDNLVMTFDVDGSGAALAGGANGVRVYKQNGGLVNIDAGMEAFQWHNDANDTFYYAAGTGTYALAPGSYARTQVGIPASGGLGGGFAMATATQAYEWLDDTGASEIVDLMPSAAGGVCNNPGPGSRLACADDAACTGTCVDPGNGLVCSGGPRDSQPCNGNPDCAFTCSRGGARHTLIGVPTIRQVLGVGEQMYVRGEDASGNGLIAVVDAQSFFGLTEASCDVSGSACATSDGCCSNPITPTFALAAGDYSLNAIALSRTGELTFAGLRNADGAHVVGNCVGDGVCTVLSATAPIVTTLTRIN